ncbi:hypothetical protein BV22DRAFT_1035610, partial [Leucogyrophana mollusca]
MIVSEGPAWVVSFAFHPAIALHVENRMSAISSVAAHLSHRQDRIVPSQIEAWILPREHAGLLGLQGKSGLKYFVPEFCARVRCCEPLKVMGSDLHSRERTASTPLPHFLVNPMAPGGMPSYSQG